MFDDQLKVPLHGYVGVVVAVLVVVFGFVTYMKNI